MLYNLAIIIVTFLQFYRPTLLLGGWAHVASWFAFKSYFTFPQIFKRVENIRRTKLSLHQTFIQILFTNSLVDFERVYIISVNCVRFPKAAKNIIHFTTQGLYPLGLGLVFSTIWLVVYSVFRDIKRGLLVITSNR